MRLYYRSALFTVALLFTAACDDSRRVTGKVHIEISGAVKKTITGQAEAGCSTTMNGDGYSFAISLPEDSAERQPMRMSMRGAAPMFAWLAKHQPSRVAVS
jgi:hypothetical protein